MIFEHEEFEWIFVNNLVTHVLLMIETDVFRVNMNKMNFYIK